MKRFMLILISVIAIVSGVVNLAAYRTASAAPLAGPPQSRAMAIVVDSDTVFHSGSQGLKVYVQGDLFY